MTLVRQFLKHANALEIFWLVGFQEDVQRGWLVLTVTHDLETGKLKLWQLPIGMLPLLAPGRVFIHGCQSRTPHRGRSLVLRVDDVGAAEEVTTTAIPSEVFSFGKPPAGQGHSIQALLTARIAALGFAAKASRTGLGLPPDFRMMLRAQLRM